MTFKTRADDGELTVALNNYRSVFFSVEQFEITAIVVSEISVYLRQWRPDISATKNPNGLSILFNTFGNVSPTEVKLASSEISSWSKWQNPYIRRWRTNLHLESMITRAARLSSGIVNEATCPVVMSTYNPSQCFSEMKNRKQRFHQPMHMTKWTSKRTRWSWRPVEAWAQHEFKEKQADTRHDPGGSYRCDSNGCLVRSY